MNAAPSPPHGQVTLVDCLSGLSVLQGAIVGSVWGGINYGFWGAVFGLPIGAVLGWVTLFALLLVLFAGILAVVVWIKNGLQAAKLFLRGHRAPPDDTTTPVG